MAAYVTYTTAAVAGLDATRRVVERVHRTQAAADARAVALAGVTAHRGAVSDEVDVGWWITIAGAGAGTVSGVAPALAADTARKRDAARQAHKVMLNWTSRLAAAGIIQDSKILSLGHDYLYRAHQALYLIARSAYTADQIVDWCGQLALGASDVTSPREFFLRLRDSSGTDITRPVGPCAWVQWRIARGTPAQGGWGERVPLGQAIAASGAASPQRPGGLNIYHRGDDLPGDGLPVDGSWIDTIA